MKEEHPWDSDKKTVKAYTLTPQGREAQWLGVVEGVFARSRVTEPSYKEWRAMPAEEKTDLEYVVWEAQASHLGRIQSLADELELFLKELAPLGGLDILLDPLFPDMGSRALEADLWEPYKHGFHQGFNRAAYVGNDLGRSTSKAFNIVVQEAPLPRKGSEDEDSEVWTDVFLWPTKETTTQIERIVQRDRVSIIMGITPKSEDYADWYWLCCTGAILNAESQTKQPGEFVFDVVEKSRVNLEHSILIRTWNEPDLKPDNNLNELSYSKFMRKMPDSVLNHNWNRVPLVTKRLSIRLMDSIINYTYGDHVITGL